MFTVEPPHRSDIKEGSEEGSTILWTQVVLLDADQIRRVDQYVLNPLALAGLSRPSTAGPWGDWSVGGETLYSAEVGRRRSDKTGKKAKPNLLLFRTLGGYTTETSGSSRWRGMVDLLPRMEAARLQQHPELQGIHVTMDKGLPTPTRKPRRARNLSKVPRYRQPRLLHNSSALC